MINTLPGPNGIYTTNSAGNLIDQRSSTSVNDGRVSMTSGLRHLSIIAYAIPSERARPLIPKSFQLEETLLHGRKTTWLSIVSFLDSGSRLNKSAFEQTNYRLHVIRDGRPAHWLLGMSVGSLSAVAMRNLWPMPWHLSAMEFQAAYDKNKGCYRNYRLQTQSEWSNSQWEISDTGESIYLDRVGESFLPASFQASGMSDYFIRRDGALGMYKANYSSLSLTRGRLKHAQSDTLERLRLLDHDEIQRPALVGVQHETQRQFFSPTVLSEGNMFSGYGRINHPGRLKPAFA